MCHRKGIRIKKSGYGRGAWARALAGILTPKGQKKGKNLETAEPPIGQGQQKPQHLVRDGGKRSLQKEKKKKKKKKRRKKNSVTLIQGGCIAGGEIMAGLKSQKRRRQLKVNPSKNDVGGEKTGESRKN